MPALQGVSPIEGLPSRARSAKRLAVFYAAGALALAANALPGGRRVRTYHSAITRDRHPDWYRSDVGLLFRLHAGGHLHPLIAARLPLTAAQHAHKLLAKGGVHGKIVLMCHGLGSVVTG